MADASTLVNSSFYGSGVGGTANTGDNRGYYQDATAQASRLTVYPGLLIQFDFGAINGNQIELNIVQTLVMDRISKGGVHYIWKIQVPTLIGGYGTISGNTITVNGAQMVGAGFRNFVLTMYGNDIIAFRYGFETNNAYSVESGEWNGVVQLQFTNPASPATEQIEVVVINPVNNQVVYDFKAADSNPYYWGRGGEIHFQQPHTRYTLVIRKIAPHPVSFSLRAW